MQYQAIFHINEYKNTIGNEISTPHLRVMFFDSDVLNNDMNEAFDFLSGSLKKWK